MSRYKPNKDEVFAKNNSLAFSLYKDSKLDFEFHIYDRRTKRIIYYGKIGLVTLASFMDLSRLEKKKGVKPK